MKVLVINNIDIKGGAYRASVNIHKAFLKVGIESKFYDYNRSGSYFFRRLHHFLDRVSLRFYPKRANPDFFSPSLTGINIRNDKDFNDTDIINLHWINGGFISLTTLEWILNLGKPIVWTMHDFWPISGGCHLNRGCMKFTAQCGACPVLGSVKELDLSKEIWNKKFRIYQNKPIHWVTVSDWFLSKISQGSLLADAGLHKIFNAIDTGIFHPYDKQAVRTELGISFGNFVILTGGFGISKDPNKGLSDLLLSLQIIKEKQLIPIEKLTLVVFGNVKSAELNFIGQNFINAGLIDDDVLLSKYYAAADVFVCSSKQETGPTTILESMSCGTPVISYNVGVVAEIVKNEENGFICQKNEPEALVDGISYFYSMEKERRSHFGVNARDMIALNCSYETTGKKYLELFQNIIV